MRHSYSREYIANTIRVHPIVELELRRLIEESLDKCGIYYRLFSRVKTPASLEHKYQIKKYNEKTHIQDLIGFRVNVYFQEDLNICKMIMSNRFVEVDWSEKENAENEFEAAKKNGVYRLPAYLLNRISKETWGLGIDPTFEIQFKTVLFEGWHEIEHDIRYKNREIWRDNLKVGRKFNSILATLELCDNSITNVLEEMAKVLYSKKDWENMIRMHYRMKMTGAHLLSDLKKLLDDDKNVLLGKRLLECDKRLIVQELLKYNAVIALDVNAIVAFANEVCIHDNGIRSILEENDIQPQRMFTKKLGYRGVKQTPLVGNTIGKVKASIEKESFLQAIQYVQTWAYNKFGMIFDTLTEKIAAGEYCDVGYSLDIKYEKETYNYEMKSSHMDELIPKTFWVTQVKVFEANEKLWIEVENTYYSEMMLSEQEKLMNFSLPGFYTNICKEIGVVDVIPKKILCQYTWEPEQIQRLEDLLSSMERQQPVVIVVLKQEKEERPDFTWLDRKWIENLAWNIQYCAHMFVCLEDTVHLCEREGVYVVDAVRHNRKIFYDRERIDGCSYDYELGIGNAMKDGVIVNGKNAFAHKVQDMIIIWNTEV